TEIRCAGYIDFMQPDFLSLSWWGSVVVVGLLINLASAYLKPLIDRTMGRYSEKWRIRAGKKREAKEKEIKRLIEDSRLLTLKQHQAVYFFLFAIVLGVVTLAMRAEYLPQLKAAAAAANPEVITSKVVMILLLLTAGILLACLAF